MAASERAVKPADQAQRMRALDPGESFIVQSPAGSGKTELLTQRFLRLLARVEQPEQVLAITFTRKATQEMRERILRRLAQAESGAVPEKAHEKLAVGFAGEVLGRDTELGWQLRRNPQRLQIHTIDGLSARIAGRSPLVGHGTAGLGMVENAESLYREAARRLIEDAGQSGGIPGLHEALVTALSHVEGRTQNLCQLLTGMLGKRDQWLKRMGLQYREMREVLAHQQAAELEFLESKLGRDRIAALTEALAGLAGTAEERDSAAAFLAATGAGATADDPHARTRAVHAALELAASSSLEPYSPRSINRYVLKGDGPERLDHVEAIKGIVERWRADEAAVQVFKRFVKAPPLEGHGSTQALLEALQALLKAATAELSVLFLEEGRADFQHVADLARQALGGEGEPGEALLAEDLRLAHILMDEFQDTSHSQAILLHRLVSGWEPGDGRTLFLVGDPMQSIYRFREADVKLFKQVFSQRRLGGVPVEPVTLTSNFRSRGELIEWVNGQFTRVFQAPPGPAYGAVPYAPVTAERGSGGTVKVHTWCDARGAEEEANRVAALVADRRNDSPGTRIAVLVRARKHLESIARALRARDVEFEAVRVEPLGGRPVVLDLLAFTRAILHPADRVAWLALLRAPWCGLSNAQLHLAAGEDRRVDVLARLGTKEALAGLPPDRAARLARFGEVMRRITAHRGRRPLHRLVEAAWLGCSGPYAVASALELENAQQFFDLLAGLEAEQPPDLLGALQERLGDWYSAANGAAVQLMTIHQAKGLEFDMVILPGMHRGTRRTQPQLLRTLELPMDAGPGVLMAPLNRRGCGEASLYNYLELLDAEEEECEVQRTLYVAATRAREELHLFGAWKFTGPQNDRRPGCDQHTFLRLLWPCFEALIDPEVGEEPGGDESAPPPVLPQLQLRGEPQTEWPADDAAPENDAAELRLAERNAAALGEALHLWLELMHNHWERGWTAEWFERHPEALDSSLLRAGAEPGALPVLQERLIHAIRNMLQEEQALSIVSPEGKTASWAELAMLSREGTSLRRNVLDRLYCIDQEHCMIVDYKTGQGDESQRTKWIEQLDRYLAPAEQLTGKPTEARVMLVAEEVQLASASNLTGRAS